MATDAFDVDQVTVLSVALSGLTVAVRMVSSPSVSVRVVLSSWMEVTGTTFALTVTVHWAVLPPACAVMMVVPGLRAFTLPSVTVATDEADEIHSTVLSVASSGLTVAVRTASSPSVSSREVLSSSMEVTVMKRLLTVTTHVAVLPPAFAVIVAVPSFTAVTFPLATVAMVASEEVHVTVLSVASSGLTVAVRVASSPSVSSSEVLSSWTEVTAIIRWETRTLQLADLPPAVAVTVALPGLSAFTRPLFTETTVSSDERQDTDLSVASLGLTVAVRVASSPSARSRDVLLSSTEDTGTVSSPPSQAKMKGKAIAPIARKRNSLFMAIKV